MRTKCKRSCPVCVSILILVCFLMLVLSFLVSCTKEEPIRVGFVAGLTGRHYDLGISNRNGVMLALEEINEQGGIHGRQIELLIRDDKQDADTARAAVRDLIQGGVVAILGHATSAMSEATYPLINEAGILMLSATTSSSDFAGKNDYFFMMQPSTLRATSFFADYAYGKLGVRRVAIIYDLSNKSYTQAWNDNFSRHFEAAGGQVMRSVSFVSGADNSFGAIAQEAVKSRPDGFMIVANALDTAMICQQIRKQDRRSIVLTAEWAFTSDLLKHGGQSVEGVYFTQKNNLQGTEPRYLAFKEKYAKRFGRQPDFASVFSYESMIVLAEGLKRNATRQGVREAILQIGSFEGLQGTLRFDANGDAERRQYIFAVRNNEFKLVE